MMEYGLNTMLHYSKGVRATDHGQLATRDKQLATGDLQRPIFGGQRT